MKKIKINHIKKLKQIIANYQKAQDYPEYFSFPISLQFELTSKCNLRCLHCYNRSGDKDKLTQMTISDWKRLCREIVANGGIFYCIISGGEPFLLGEGLFEIMDILHEDGTVFTLISNGYYITEKIAKRLTKYNFTRIQLSIDAPRKELHDWFRQKKGSFEKVINAALYISSYGLPLSIATTIYPQNLDYMFEMAELSYNLGASSIIMGKVLKSGRAVFNKEIMLNKAQEKIMNNNIKKLRKIYKDKMIIIEGAEDYYGLLLQESLPNEGVIIRPDGNVRLDCTAPFIIGNVLKESFKEIWEKRAIKAWKNVEVKRYIESVINGDPSLLGLINHVTEDKRLYCNKKR